MKKLTLTIVTLIAVLIVFQSCKKEKENYLSAQLTVEKFNNYGKIHNKFLENIKGFFETNVNPINLSKKEKINFINQINKKYVEENQDFNVLDKNVFILALDKNKRFIDNKLLLDELFNKKKDQYEVEDIYDKILNLKNNNKLTDFGFDLLNNFIHDLEENKNGFMSNTMFKQKVIDYIQLYDNHKYSINSGEGQLIGVILSISINTINWWENNPNIIPDAKLPLWAALDIAGAVGGATGSILQDVFNDNDINWKSAAAWAIGGAVSGSTGVWLAKLKIIK